MTPLFSAALFGLAALAVPVIIHLIARHKYPVRDFPSLYLLRYERRDNAFARRLIDPLQLLLRLLVLALLALAMARLFSPADSGEPAPRNLVVVIDTSASMAILSAKERESGERPPIDRARDIATELLKGVELPSRCSLVLAGDEIRAVTPLTPDPALALAELDFLRAGDGTGAGLVQAIANGGELMRGRREVKSQVIVLTDRRATAFETRNHRDLAAIKDLQDSMGDRLEIVLVDLGGDDVENLGLTAAELRGRTVRIGDDAHVVTTVRNFGVTNATGRLRLGVGGKKGRPSREIELEAGEHAVVALTMPVKRALRGYGSVHLESEDIAEHDNLYTLPLVVEASRRVLIVNGAAEDMGAAGAEDSALAALGGGGGGDEEEEEGTRIDGARILQFVLNPGRELGRAFGTGIDTEQITAEALPAQTLSKYDTVILYDVGTLSDTSLKDLSTFVSDGRSLIIFCSATINPNEFNATIGAPGVERAALSPVRIGTDEVLDSPISIDLAGGYAADFGEDVTFDPGLWAAPFRDRREGNLSTIRFRTIRKAVAIEPGAVVRLQGGGRALAVEASRGQGRVMTVLYGLELGRGNIAMTKVFPLLTWRLMDYLSGKLQSRPPDTLVAATPAALDVGEPAFRFINEFELSPANEQPRSNIEELTAEDAAEGGGLDTLALDPNEQRTVYVGGVRAGNYWLRKRRGSSMAAPSSYMRPVTVNPDVRESRMDRTADEDLQSFLNGKATLIPETDIASLMPYGFEWWRWLVIGLVAAYLIEAILAYVTGVIRDRRQEALEKEDAADAALAREDA